MKKLLLASAATAMIAGAAGAEDVKIGVVSGFTGPLESLAPAIGGGSFIAIDEVNASGKFMDGSKIVAVQGDDTCGDAAAGTAMIERLITADKVNAIVGGSCSGVTGAMLSNVAVPNGIAMISPSATSPGLSTAEDNGLFFRTAPSDARQGEIVAAILAERGVKTIALTYTNNDYGKGLADAIASNFTAAGGTVTINAAHEDGKADYSAEVGALAAAGGEVLVVAGYVDQGGSAIVRSSLDTGAFSTFYFPDGMVGEKLNENFGAEINGSYGAHPGTDSEGAALYAGIATAAGIDGTGAFSPEGYDAAALIMLAMQAAKSTKSTDLATKVMDVANAPGEKILPGELGKALELIAAGTDIDYEGASAVELIGPGESKGNYREIEFTDGKYGTVKFW